MVDDVQRILVLESHIDPVRLRRLVSQGFGDMVKYVVDVERGLIAIGGEMHADAEQALLEAGSLQENLWGANYYPGRGREGCIEFSSLINIRPSQGNRSMVVQDVRIQGKIRALTYALVGEGEAL